MKKILTGWCLLAVLSLSGCRTPSFSEAEKFPSFPDSLLREGDLVFRRGEGLTSRAVLLADHHSVYSHTGIVVRGGTEWQVIHIVPGEPDQNGDRDRIKMESLDRFFAPERAVKGAVMRPYDSPTAALAARQAVRLLGKGILFDHTYNLDDTTRMYCTELIQRIFQMEGIDLTEGKRSRINFPGFRGDYILPGDIQRSPYLKMICEF